MDENGITPLNQTRSLDRMGVQSLREETILDVSPEEAPRLLDYWHVILKRRWIILTTLLIVFTTVAIGTFKETRRYSGNVLIEIDPEEPQVLSFQQVAQTGPSWDLDSYRETQYKVLESRSLAERVVRDLRLYQYPEFYQNQKLLGLITSNPDHIPSPSDASPPDPSSEAYRNSIDHFLKSLDIEPVRRSNLVEVSFLSQSPELAARIVNQLGENYIDQNLQVKWDEALKASEWLSTRLVELKARLEKSEDALQTYAKANSILFVQNAQTAAYQNLAEARLSQLQEEYTKAQADRFEKESLYSLVKEGKVQDLPGVLSNHLIQDLSVQVAEL